MTAGVTHVITAFAPDTTFNWGSSYTPFMPLDQVRALFDEGTKVCLAVGGWGDTTGFGVAAASDSSRKTYAQNIATALDALGYDCVGKSEPEVHDLQSMTSISSQKYRHRLGVPWWQR